MGLFRIREGHAVKAPLDADNMKNTLVKNYTPAGVNELLTWADLLPFYGKKHCIIWLGY